MKMPCHITDERDELKQIADAMELGYQLATKQPLPRLSAETALEWDRRFAWHEDRRRLELDSWPGGCK